MKALLTGYFNQKMKVCLILLLHVFFSLSADQQIRKGTIDEGLKIEATSQFEVSKCVAR